MGLDLRALKGPAGEPRSDAVLTCLADLLVYLDMQVDNPEKEHVTD